MTIEDPAAFISVFDPHRNQHIYNQQEAVNSARKFDDLLNAFYNNGSYTINEDSASNEDDEVRFLRMLSYINSGIALFEIDNTFTTFTRVKGVSGTANIISTTCN
jgi:hypothetical protein